VKELKLPEECVIISVLHDEKVIYPRGNTQIEKDDKVLLITNHPVLTDLMNHLHNRGIKYASK
jgi:trk system potassium uptake protein TrkA